MGHELRCFYPLPLPSTPSYCPLICEDEDKGRSNYQPLLDRHLLSLAFSPNSLFDSALAEKRTDEYINLDTAEYGLKFRSGQQLELKTRTAVISSVNNTMQFPVEEWNKTVLGVKGKTMEAVHKALSDSCPKAAKLLPAVKSEYEKSIVSMKKARIQSFGSVVWEVTDLEVTVPSASSSPAQWRTVCFEQGKPEIMVALMKTFWTHYNVVVDGGSQKPLQVMSYPEFLLNI
eukprot:TRINITY_DN13044_c0_g1_i1.p1 TRINITY_DN13044_c0_g1~~TRINITY_DN13044_c0_g1_i1.p1  ORF type:complete len:231 (+),score=52.43 TRINITY_DN13044_c0_g1_i1:75-767(+)